MTPPTLEWHREESEDSRRFYELVQATWPDKYHGWKVNALFYSALHRINHWLVRQMGRAPGNHAERNRRVKGELPLVLDDYNGLYELSMQARYRKGHMLKDHRHKSAYERLYGIEEMLPFQIAT